MITQRPRRSRAFLWLLLPMAFGCTTVTPHHTHIDGEAMLLGTIDKEELGEAYPIFKRRERAYVPQRSTMKQLQDPMKGIETILFLGTWCSDSRSEVPKFLKIHEQLSGESAPAPIYAVDRDMNDPGNNGSEFNIEFVPTIIVLRDGREAGRIVEFPELTMEEELLAIVTKSTQDR